LLKVDVIISQQELSVETHKYLLDAHE